MRDPTKCNNREEAFCLAYVQLNDRVKAFAVAYDADTTDRDIKRRASTEFRKMRVQQRIHQLETQIEKNTLEVVRIETEKREKTGTQVLERSMFDAMQVMRHWMDIATADPTKIVTHRRVNCRHCHGTDHKYQWKSREEFTAAVAAVIDMNGQRERMRPKQKPLELPSDAGGFLFAFNAMPHKDCPNCRGEGHSDVLVYDVSQLDQKERRLIKSIRLKKGDVEVEFHDQAAAVVNIAKALGMLTEKVKFVDPAEATDTPALPLDPVEASRLYTQMVKGY